MYKATEIRILAPKLVPSKEETSVMSQRWKYLLPQLHPRFIGFVLSRFGDISLLYNHRLPTDPSFLSFPLRTSYQATFIFPY